jgi:hypothetical protein
MCFGKATRIAHRLHQAEDRAACRCTSQQVAGVCNRRSVFVQICSDEIETSCRLLVVDGNECLFDIYHFASFHSAGSRNCADFKRPEPPFPLGVVT